MSRLHTKISAVNLPRGANGMEGAGKGRRGGGEKTREGMEPHAMRHAGRQAIVKTHQGCQLPLTL
jgi:hypothetical protein